MSLPIEFDSRTNVAMLGGESLVFHCHHYNCALQRAIEEGLGDDAVDLLQRAGQEVSREQGAKLKGANSLGDAAQRFALLGFGRWDLAQIANGRGTAVLHASHYGLGWISKYGERKTPACHFAAGYLAGSIAIALGLAAERVRVRETKCCATGADVCSFEAEVL